jgi:mannose-6-phosphate isomerase
MIRLERSFHAKVWGANSLGPWFGDRAEKIGEVWFTHTPPLPLLVKFIFTTGRLSVQVHPSGKTEMWHVLRAEPDAVIAVGFRKAISPERARRAALSGEIVDLLDWRPARPGVNFHVPAGTVHAIGAGVVLCEIQQNCDVTYRLYDYGRPRELHLEQALEVAHLTPATGTVRCFATDLVEAAPGRLDLTRNEEQILVFLEGSGNLGEERFTAGEAWLAPPGQAIVLTEAATRLLRTYVPEMRGRSTHSPIPRSGIGE